MKKINNSKLLIPLIFITFFFVVFFLSACNFDNNALQKQINKIKKNFNKNFTPSVYNSAIISYGKNIKDYKNLDLYFCKKTDDDTVEINGNVYLIYLPNTNVYIDGIAPTGDDNFTFYCYFKNITGQGKLEAPDSYIEFSMTDTDFTSVTVVKFF